MYKRRLYSRTEKLIDMHVVRKFDPSASEAWDHGRGLELGAELEEVDPRALCGGGGGGGRRLEDEVAAV